VFEPYFTTKPTGTGLGLAIAHHVVEAMGGDIAVASRLGVGTTFTLKLPLTRTN
jgi:two-component system sensor histidine kinase HydH